MKKYLFLLCLVVPVLACERLDDSPSDHADPQNLVYAATLTEVAELFSTLPIGSGQMAEVADAVSASVGNGYDEEYTMKNLFESPGAGIGEDLTKGSVSYAEPLRDLIRSAAENRYRTKGGSSAEDFISMLSSSDIQIYWPYSELWDGETLPVITSDPMDDALRNVGYTLDGREVVVDEEMAMRRPVWVINGNRDAAYKTLELLRREDPSWGNGGGTVTVKSGGIKTLVWTDTFQTACMFTALILIIVQVTKAMGLSTSEAVNAIMNDAHSRVFVFDDWMSKQYFWKQFLSGIFIVIVMTGLDQDMMQKNLTCKTLREAQKDMCTYGLAFVPANLLFMALGVLLILYAKQQGVALPAAGDELLPMFAASGALGNVVVVLFTIGIVAASFSSADSALTAMTTSFCVDICGRKDDERLRKRAHIVIAFCFMMLILMVKALNSSSVIDVIYTLCSYTYGPLLGLFAFSILTKRRVNDRYAPYIAIASPVLCYLLQVVVKETTGYQFGYELLMLNGLLTFIGLWMSGKLLSL